MTDYHALHCEAAAYARANAAEERVRELEAEVALWREYEQFLHDANEAPISIAFAHGWRVSFETFDRGEEYRRRLGVRQSESVPLSTGQGDGR